MSVNFFQKPFCVLLTREQRHGEVSLSEAQPSVLPARRTMSLLRKKGIYHGATKENGKMMLYSYSEYMPVKGRTFNRVTFRGL